MFMKSSTKISMNLSKQTFDTVLYMNMSNHDIHVKDFSRSLFSPALPGPKTGTGGMEADPHASGETQQLMHHGLSEGRA